MWRPEQSGPTAIGAGVAALATRYGLPGGAAGQLEAFAELLSSDPTAPTGVRDPQAVLNDHLADSLVALELQCVRIAKSAVDIGTGAGLPGIPLAIAKPDCSFVLMESVTRKCSFLARVAEASSVANVKVACARAEEPYPGFGGSDLALVRAVGRLDVVLEYGAPLLRLGGWLVAWRGRRDPMAEVEAEIAADILGLQPEDVRPAKPYEGSRHRYLHLFSKVRETPSRFPRPPGRASKRPLGVRRDGGRRLAR